MCEIMKYVTAVASMQNDGGYIRWAYKLSSLWLTKRPDIMYLIHYGVINGNMFCASCEGTQS